MSLFNDIPPAEEVLNMDPEELAPYVLNHLKSLPENSLNRYNFSLMHDQELREALGNDHRKVDNLSKKLMETWMCLEREGFVAPKPGQSGDWAFVTSKGKEFAEIGNLEAYKMAKLFRNDMDDVLVREVRPLYIRGDYDTAIFRAFKEVEVRVRQKAGLSNGDYGVELMNKAFGPTGKLTNQSVPEGEQAATRQLFVGAVGVFKNPASHREVDYTDPKEVMETICFASQLLRMVDRI